MFRKSGPQSRQYWLDLEDQQIDAELLVIEHLLDNPFDHQNNQLNLVKSLRDNPSQNLGTIEFNFFREILAEENCAHIEHLYSLKELHKESNELYKKELEKLFNKLEGKRSTKEQPLVERHKKLAERQLTVRELQANHEQSLSLDDCLKQIDSDLLELENSEHLLNEYEEAAASQGFHKLKKIRKKRKAYLKALNFLDEPVEEKPHLSPTKKILTVFSAIFDTAKKIIDSADDIWYGIQRAVNNPIIKAIGPILSGAISLIVLPYEALVSAGKMFGTFWNNKIDKQRRVVKMITHSVGAVLAFGGSVMAALILLQGAGIQIASFVSTVFPNVLSIVLLTVYAFRLIDSIDNYRFRSKQLAATETNLAICNAAANLLKKDPANLSENEKNLMDQYTALANKCGLDPADPGTYAILKERFTLAAEFHQQKLRNAKQKIILNSIEVFAMTIVVIGTILGAAAFVGATSAATFGIAPTVIVAVGVAIGLGLKLYEANHKYHLVDKAINLCKRLYHKAMGTKTEPERPHSTPTPKPSMWSRMLKTLGAATNATCQEVPKVTQTMLATQPFAVPDILFPSQPSSTAAHSAGLFGSSNRSSVRQSRAAKTEPSSSPSPSRY